MPQITESTVQAFAHCRDARCDGYSQELVQATRVLDERFFTDNGGDLPGTERSFVYLSFADPDEAPCPSCGHAREVTDSPRPSYQPESGFPQDGLLGVPKFNAAKAVDDPRVGELEAKLEAQSAQVELLLKALEDRD